MTARKPPTNKECIYCGESFLYTRRRRRLCSDACNRAIDIKRSLKRYYKANPPEKTKTIQCLYCGVDFETKRYKIYCCKEHRILADRKRLRANTPENKKRPIKHRGWTVRERKAYGSKYWREVTLPRINKQREAEAKALAMIKPEIPPMQLQGLSPEQISKYWHRIG